MRAALTGGFIRGYLSPTKYTTTSQTMMERGILQFPAWYHGSYVTSLRVCCSRRCGGSVASVWGVFYCQASLSQLQMSSECSNARGRWYLHLLSTRPSHHHHLGSPLILFSPSTSFSALACVCWSSSHGLIQMIFLPFKLNYSALLFICSIVVLPFLCSPSSSWLPPPWPKKKPAFTKALTQE